MYGLPTEVQKYGMLLQLSFRGKLVLLMQEKVGSYHDVIIW